MGTFQGGDDTFQFRQFVGGADGFIIINSKYDGTFLCSQIGMHGADTRVIQSGRDRVGLFDLAVFVLDDVSACTVNDSHLSEGDGSGSHTCIYSFTTGFGEDDLHAAIVDIMVNGSGGIATTTYTSDKIVGAVTAFFLNELLFDFLADDGLQASHHVGIRMRTDCGTDDVVGIGRMTTPVADCLVGSIFQRHISGSDGDDGCTQHLHFFYIDMLAFYIRFSHVDDAFHVHQGTYGGSSYSVLSGTGFGDDAMLAHAACQKNLSDSVVNLVSSCMVQVFTFEVELAAILFGKPAGIVEWGRTSYVVTQQLVELLLEIFALQYFEIGVLQLFHTLVEYFGNICSTEFSVITILIY